MLLIRRGFSLAIPAAALMSLVVASTAIRAQNPSGSMLTQHNDSGRSGANLSETVLNITNVNVQPVWKAVYQTSRRSDLCAASLRSRDGFGPKGAVDRGNPCSSGCCGKSGPQCSMTPYLLCPFEWALRAPDRHAVRERGLGDQRSNDGRSASERDDTSRRNAVGYRNLRIPG